MAPSYGTGSHGNVSVRTPDGCLISATRTFLGTLTETQFVELVGCDLTTTPPTVRYRGALLPSTDSLIHWQLYQQRPDATCVLHAHDAATLTAAAALKLPITTRAADAGSPELLTLIRPLIHHAYFLVRAHGFVASGPRLDDVGALATNLHAQALALLNNTASAAS